MRERDELRVDPEARKREGFPHGDGGVRGRHGGRIGAAVGEAVVIAGAVGGEDWIWGWGYSEAEEGAEWLSVVLCAAVVRRFG